MREALRELTNKTNKTNATNITKAVPQLNKKNNLPDTLSKDSNREVFR
jgi:hypothetical protein